MQVEMRFRNKPFLKLAEIISKVILEIIYLFETFLYVQVYCNCLVQLNANFTKS